jgi:hypothetical protein
MSSTSEYYDMTTYKFDPDLELLPPKKPVHVYRDIPIYKLDGEYCFTFNNHNYCLPTMVKACKAIDSMLPCY